jgi:hypothetical protein
MEIDSRSQVCPVCGYEFPLTNKTYVIVAIILLTVIVLYFIF